MTTVTSTTYPTFSAPPSPQSQPQQLLFLPLPLYFHLHHSHSHDNSYLYRFPYISNSTSTTVTTMTTATSTASPTFQAPPPPVTTMTTATSTTSLYITSPNTTITTTTTLIPFSYKEISIHHITSTNLLINMSIKHARNPSMNQNQSNKRQSSLCPSPLFMLTDVSKNRAYSRSKGERLLTLSL